MESIPDFYQTFNSICDYRSDCHINPDLKCDLNLIPLSLSWENNLTSLELNNKSKQENFIGPLYYLDIKIPKTLRSNFIDTKLRVHIPRYGLRSKVINIFLPESREISLDSIYEVEYYRWYKEINSSNNKRRHRYLDLINSKEKKVKVYTKLIKKEYWIVNNLTEGISTGRVRSYTSTLNRDPLKTQCIQPSPKVIKSIEVLRTDDDSLSNPNYIDYIDELSLFDIDRIEDLERNVIDSSFWKFVEIEECNSISQHTNESIAIKRGIKWIKKDVFIPGEVYKIFYRKPLTLCDITVNLDNATNYHLHQSNPVICKTYRGHKSIYLQ